LPQDVDFQCPFPERLSPDADGARERSLAWAKYHGLVANPDAESRFHAWDIAGLMAMWVPLAVGAELDLAVASVLWGTIFDDQFDGALGVQTGRVEQLCTGFIAITRCDPRLLSPDALLTSPLARAFDDVRARLCAGATPYWVARLNEHFRWFIGAYSDEATNRAARDVPDRERFMELRRRSGYVYMMVDLIERCYGFELSQRAYELPPISRMLDITADFVDTVNDVHSVEKEERWGDVNNLVMVVERELGCSRAESIAEIVALTGSWCRKFVDLEESLPQACAVAGLTDAETASAQRLAAGMRDVMAGYLAWSRTTSRYANLVPEGEAAYDSLL